MSLSFSIQQVANTYWLLLTKTKLLVMMESFLIYSTRLIFSTTYINHKSLQILAFLQTKYSFQLKGEKKHYHTQ